MNDVTLVLEGQALTGVRGAGVNAYAYQRDGLTHQLLLSRTYELLPPGGNRVCAALEIASPDQDSVLAVIDVLEADPMPEGERWIHGARVQLMLPGKEQAGPDQVREILGAFRLLLKPAPKATDPLVFERRVLEEVTSYRLTEASRQRLRGLVPGPLPDRAVIAHDVQPLFEAQHGAFEQHLALAAIPGLSWQRLADLGGYVVLQDGQECFRWPRFQ